MLALTHDDLCACLVAVPPVELLGMTLLKQGSPQLHPFDVPRDTLREAVTEIVAYTGRCTTAAQRLSNLAPVPLMGIAIPEFGL